MENKTLKQIIIDDSGTRKDGSPNVAKFARKWELPKRSVQNHLYGVYTINPFAALAYKLISIVNIKGENNE